MKARAQDAMKEKPIKPAVGWGFRQADATLLGVFEYEKGKPGGFCRPIRVVILPLVKYRRLKRIEKAAMGHLTVTGGNSPSLEKLAKEVLAKEVGHAKA